jgi:small subunit ribosomal protein S1
VAKVVPFGLFVQVADGVEGLVPLRDLGSVPVAAPEDVVRIGDGVSVTVMSVDRERHRLTLSQRPA